MISGFKLQTPPPPGMAGMGQVIPSIPQATTQKVIYLALGAVAFSLGMYLILKGKKK